MCPYPRWGNYLVIFALLVGCTTIVIDRSLPAVEAGDYTIAMSAGCGAVPGLGMDVCHVRAGTKIEAVWNLAVPSGHKEILGGEVDVYYRDVHKSYGITGRVVSIPWKDFFGSDTWESSMDGEALALVLIRYKTPEGIEEIAKYRGIAKIVVTKEGYDRLPIDSGFGAFTSTCRIVYSTAGRSAMECK